MSNDQLVTDKLFAWCIVPFDARHRNPEERAQMLTRLGFNAYVYDWRQEHIPEFEQEIETMIKHGIEILGWWMPRQLDENAKHILALFKRYNIKPQLWVTYGGDINATGEAHAQLIKEHYEMIAPIVDAGAEQGLTVGLYNHMQWFGEPENELELIAKFHNAGHDNLGLVYNFHHGHGHIDRFAEVMDLIKPHLLCLNLNGMDRRGMDWTHKILPLGQGECELDMMRIVARSGWRGPIGLLNHTKEDSEARLQDNLDGFAWCQHVLAGEVPGPKPTPRSWKSAE